VNIIGIVDAVEFRKAVLDQRDRLASGGQTAAASPAAPAPAVTDGSAEILSEIRDVLVRIESKLGDS